ncbi:hypothetical protein [Microbacterium sp. NPDC089695]|uniref:hypothetical protein n=1 Tax=Microbacterium sp. NPDC089695 TaxID=3364198 RepID=UPI0038032F7C
MKSGNDVVRVACALLMTVALVANGASAANAQDTTVSEALDSAPMSEGVLNGQEESLALELSSGEGDLVAINDGVQEARISYDLDSGVALTITAQDDASSAGVETTAQVLDDESARLLSVFTNPSDTLVMNYTTEIPDGWVPQLRADGGVDIVPGAVLREGLRANGLSGEFVLATVDAPWAVDAAGQDVETYFEINDEQLHQIVKPGQDAVYPITADPRVVGHGYYFSIHYSKKETRGMRDTGAVVGFILAAGAAIAALPGGVAIAAVLYTVGAGAVAAIATVAGNASGEDRCLKLDVPSFIPTSVRC